MLLDLDGLGPAYQQVTRALRTAILNGSLCAGKRLPPTRALAQDLGMSRITVLSAYDQLRTEGYLQSRVGSGSYVSAQPLAPPFRSRGVGSILAPSRYAQRARTQSDKTTDQMHHGLRFDLQYQETSSHLALNNLWGKELSRAAAHTPLERAVSEGSVALRQQICTYLAHWRGVRANPEDVVVVNSSQQAFDLAARVLIDEGDSVVIEEPHQSAAWRSFAALGAQLQAVRTDDEGLVCAELPEHAPRLVYVTPSHQFPSGPAMSLPRRLELLRYAEVNACWIVEDDDDSEFRYSSQPLAALRSLDQDDRVIYVGTFSKALFGSARLAYMVIPSALRQDFVNARHLSDPGGLAIQHAALAHFMESGAYERQLRKVGKMFRERREVLLDGLRTYAGPRVLVADSHAGMQMAVWLPDYEHAQLDKLIQHAHDRGLGLYPIAPFYHQRPAVPGLLFGYCGLPSSELREATRLFGSCLDALDAERAEIAGAVSLNPVPMAV